MIQQITHTGGQSVNAKLKRLCNHQAHTPQNFVRKLRQSVYPQYPCLLLPEGVQLHLSDHQALGWWKRQHRLFEIGRRLDVVWRGPYEG